MSAPRLHLSHWLSRTLMVLSSLMLLAFGLLIGALLIFERAQPGSAPAVVSSDERTVDQRYADAVSSARRHVYAIMEKRQIPGMAVAVEVDGRLVWSQAFGYADLENKTLATPRTRFRIASVSKLLTVAAMARLWEDGLLDLDAPIKTYVSEFPDKGHVITARQLASHRSGIRSYRDDFEAVELRHYASVSQSLDRFKDDPLVFAPDTDFLYSVYGYALLSAVIESAAGEDFLTCVHRLALDPLEMNGTGPADQTAPGQSAFYDNVTPYSRDGQIEPSPKNDFSFKWSSGGFVSTAEDLARFGSAHIASRGQAFLKPETLETLFRPRTRQMGLIGYGLGWMTMRDLHLRRACFHFGAGSGATSALFVYPEQRTSIALVANLGHAKLPFNHLMGVFNPFLGSGALFGAGALVVAANALSWGLHCRTRRILKGPHSQSPGTPEQSFR